MNKRPLLNNLAALLVDTRPAPQPLKQDFQDLWKAAKTRPVRTALTAGLPVISMGLGMVLTLDTYNWNLEKMSADFSKSLPAGINEKIHAAGLRLSRLTMKKEHPIVNVPVPRAGLRIDQTEEVDALTAALPSNQPVR